jgi:hypothetical protein
MWKGQNKNKPVTMNMKRTGMVEYMEITEFEPFKL